MATVWDQINSQIQQQQQAANQAATNRQTANDNFRAKYGENAYNPYDTSSGIQIDTSQAPMFPTYQSMLDQNTGGLKSQFQMTPTLLKDTDYSAKALAQQRAEQSTLADQAARSAAGAGAQANARLAMRGGLGGGARERGAYQSALDAAIAKQGVAQQGATARANIGLQDELMRAEREKANFAAQNAAQQYNLTNTVNQYSAGNQYSMDLYKQAAALYGAKQSSEAAKRAANQAASTSGLFGGGGVLGTGIYL